MKEILKGTRIVEHIKRVRQKDDYSCGPACIQMMFSCFNVEFSQEEITDLNDPCECGYDWEDVIKIIYPLCRNLGFEFKNYASYEDLIQRSEQGFPIMIRYQKYEEDGDHFSIVFRATTEEIFLVDPAEDNMIRIQRGEFERKWTSIDDHRSYLCFFPPEN